MSSVIAVMTETHTEGARKHYLVFDRFEPVAKDHTAIKEAKTCLRRYFFAIVLGLRPNEENVVFAWGRAYHTFREVLSVEYGYGANTPWPYDEAKAKAAYVKAAQAGLAVWTKSGKDQPIGSDWDFMTAARLLKTFVIAFKHWEFERKRGNIQVIAVEQPFVIELPDGSRTSGRADEIVRWSTRLWGRDFKTTSKEEKFFVRGISPNDQVTRYTYAEAQLAGQPVQGVIIEAMYNAKTIKKGERGPQVRVFTASRTEFEIDDWLQDEIQIRRILDDCRDKDRYPKNEVACPFCPFHSTCSAGSEAAQISKLKAHFHVRPWDPHRVGVIDE